MGRRGYLQMQIDGAEKRPGRAGTRLAGAEQGRPVFDEAPGAAGCVGGESRRISDTHDLAQFLSYRS